LNLSLISQNEAGVVQPPEVGQTFIENALAKARHAAFQSGLPAIADDSGLAVDALGGQPGIHSARYAGDGARDEENVVKLLQAMATIPDSNRGAVFHCVVVALAHHDDPAPLVVAGAWRGRIGHQPSGRKGFGYDPVFIGEGLNVTAAQMTAAAKNRSSHRGKALAALVLALDSTR
jgi:XTP/dITP diphosphohydrolase